MEWLLGLAILPAALCGLICVGGMALAALGMRRTAARRTCCDEPAQAHTKTEPPVTVDG